MKIKNKLGLIMITLLQIQLDDKYTVYNKNIGRHDIPIL